MTNKPVSTYIPPKVPIGSNPFTPVMVDRCEVGKHYVYRNHGPVLCQGIGPYETPYTGKIEAVTFVRVDMGDARPQAAYHVPCSKVGSRGIRELADAKTMDAVLKKITGRKADPQLLSAKFLFSAVALDSVLMAANPYALAEIVCRTFGSEREIEDRRLSAVLYGNKALDLLAIEYSLVKKVAAYEALCLLTDKSGKHDKKLNAYGGQRKGMPALTVL